MEKLNLESLEEIANRTNSENDARRELDRVGRVIYSEARRRNYSLGGLMGIYERLHNLIDARLPLRQRPPRRLPREFELDIETIAKEIVDAVKKGQIALGDAEELQRDFFKLVGPELRSFSPDKFFDKTNRGLEPLRFLPAGSSANNEVSKKNDFRTATARSGFMEGMRRLDDTVNGRQDAQATSNKKESKLIPEFSRFIEGMKNLNDRLEFERLQKNRIQPTDTTGQLQSSESEMNPDDIGIEVGAMPNYGRFERASEGGFEKDETAAPRSSDKSANPHISPTP